MLKKSFPSLSDDLLNMQKDLVELDQVLNKTEKKLMLGEASIKVIRRIIFNMTPSPGANSCLGNAQRDIKKCVNL